MLTRPSRSVYSHPQVGSRPLKALSATDQNFARAVDRRALAGASWSGCSTGSRSAPTTYGARALTQISNARGAGIFLAQCQSCSPAGGLTGIRPEPDYVGTTPAC